MEGRVWMGPKFAVQLDLSGSERSQTDGYGAEANDTMVPSVGECGQRADTSSAAID